VPAYIVLYYTNILYCLLYYCIKYSILWHTYHLVDHLDATVQQLNSTDRLWLFGLVNEIEGCNYSRIEIRLETVQTHWTEENWIIVCCRSGNTGLLENHGSQMQRPKVKGLVTSLARCDRYQLVWALHLGLRIDLHRASSVWSRHVSFFIRKRRLFRGYFELFRGIVVPAAIM